VKIKNFQRKVKIPKKGNDLLEEIDNFKKIKNKIFKKVKNKKTKKYKNDTIFYKK